MYLKQTDFNVRAWIVSAHLGDNWKDFVNATLGLQVPWVLAINRMTNLEDWGRWCLQLEEEKVKYDGNGRR